MNKGDAHVKDLNYYMNLPYTINIVRTESGNFVASIAELEGCITQAENETEVFKMIKDAKLCWLEVALEDNVSIPEPVNIDDFSGKFNIRIPKTLHKQLTLRAKQENVSLNQLTTYLLSSNLQKVCK